MKTNVNGADRVSNGIRIIETAVIATAQERGLWISEDSFVWASADALHTSFISANIIGNARIAELVLPVECYEESEYGVKRTEVWDAIDDCVSALLSPIQRHSTVALSAS